MTRFSCLARGLLLAVVAAAFLGAPLAEAKSTGSSSSSHSSSSSSSSHSSSGYSAPHSAAPSAPSAPSAPRSSSGYSAPPASAAPSAGSSSGYRAPTTGSAAPSALRSGSDAAMGRHASASAYTSYRATQSNFKAAAAPPAPLPSSGAFAHIQPVPSYSVLVVHRNSYYSSWGYSPPSYIYGYAPHFGMWDAIFLWSLASAASNAAQADWFYHHQYDQGYVDWRRQADIEAQQNADLRQQLATIDQRVATLESQNVPRDTNYLPPGADASVALAAENVVSRDATDANVDVTHAEAPPPARSSHFWLDLLLGAAAIAIVVFALRRRAA
jgi:hypothetical protein